MNGFDEGAGGFLTASTLSLFIQSVGVVFVLIYMVTVCLTIYQEWGVGRITTGELGMLAMRALFSLMVLLYLFII